MDGNRFQAPARVAAYSARAPARARAPRLGLTTKARYAALWRGLSFDFPSSPRLPPWATILRPLRGLEYQNRLLPNYDIAPSARARIPKPTSAKLRYCALCEGSNTKTDFCQTTILHPLRGLEYQNRLLPNTRSGLVSTTDDRTASFHRSGVNPGRPWPRARPGGFVPAR
jgi:hypothetical protein